MELFNLECIEKASILTVYNSISVDRSFHVLLSYYGLVIPLPQYNGFEIKLTVPNLNLVCLKFHI